MKIVLCYLVYRFTGAINETFLALIVQTGALGISVFT